MRKTCLDMVYKLAKRDPRVVFIGSDLSPGLLSEMKHDMPERYFMEGVTEANVIGMAAGLAMEGYVPYVNTIATFLTRRCYEQVALDLCLHNLPVRLVANGGGLVYAPLGPTHQAIEDIAIMRALPNMTVVSVCDADEMTRFMNSSLDWPGPIYIRLAKGGDAVVSREENDFSIGTAVVARCAQNDGDCVLMVSTGIMTQRALAASEILASDGIPCNVLHVHTIKPLDIDTLVAHARPAQLVVSLEEHTLVGGLGSAVTDALTEHLNGPLPRILRLGIPDVFANDYGDQDSLLDTFGLQPPPIVEAVRSSLRDIA